MHKIIESSTPLSKEDIAKIRNISIVEGVKKGYIRDEKYVKKAIEICIDNGWYKNVHDFSITINDFKKARDYVDKAIKNTQKAIEFYKKNHHAKEEKRYTAHALELENSRHCIINILKRRAGKNLINKIIG